MPPKPHRISITISPELHAALAEFRRVSGMSSASLLTLLLADAAPLVQAMTEAHRIAKSSPERALESLQGIVQEAHVGIAQTQLELQEAKSKKRKLRRRVRE